MLENTGVVLRAAGLWPCGKVPTGLHLWQHTRLVQHQLPPESPCLVVKASWIKSGHLGHREHKPSVETQACQPSTLEVEDNGSEIQGPLPLHRV